MANERTFLKVPDFQYGGDYYPQIASRLRQQNRINVPEITNEDSREPFIQGERAFALAMHYCNVLLDMVGNSVYLRTGTIPESVKLVLELINGQLLPAGPAQVDMVGELVSSFSSVQRLLEPYRKFATKRNADTPELVFENPAALDLTIRTDQIAHAYGLKYNRKATAKAILSSVDSDIVETDQTDYFDANDLNHYLSIEGSDIGNDVEDLRIVELLNEFGTYTPARYTKVRLKNGSFISETGVDWIIRKITSNVASDWNVGTKNNPLTGTLENGDKVYVGHPDVMFDKIDVELDSTPAPPAYQGVHEFYDPTDGSLPPDDVTVGTGVLTFNLNTLLGTDDVSGALVEVQYIPTGARRKAFSTFSSPNNQIEVDYMGQTVTPSTDESDYVVSADWRPLSNVTDTTIQTGIDASWSQDGSISFDLPQTRLNSWYKKRLYDHDDAEEKADFFIRYRIVSAAAASFSEPDSVEYHNGKQYGILRLVQGQTVEENPIGSSTGEADQQFTLTRVPYVLNSARIFVDEGGGEYEWAVRTSLTSSLSSDRHCVVDPQTDGTASLIFGDGVNGRIPPIGTNNIRGVYRIGADLDGNIGANTLTVNRDGVGVFRRVWNPRQGKYWISADWATQEALERAKVRGPQQLRTLYRAVSPSDCEILASTFININGVRPVARARAYEEAFGPKTIELVVTGGGGSALSSDEIEELQEYYNGGSVYGYGGILVANSEITVTNYSPRLIPLNIVVEAFPVVTEAMILQILSSLVNPTAVENDGRSFVWRYGQSVPLSRIASEVFLLAPGNVFDVDITSPSEDIQLTSRELPILDVSGTNVVIIPPSFTTA
jgi:hypothetical protein